MNDEIRNYTPLAELPKRTQPWSEGDRFRYWVAAMSDEELVYNFSSMICDMILATECKLGRDCRQCKLDFLKKEVTD